ncbi:hypothetical protein J4573_14805 [Actinomadura barringtoniae]|uniref:Aminoglycoside phosphotransferase n=1 Tax=Actinomadura barringtoniae TaxID=1427535 RepID=A0A939T6K6_9ACTN|nr:hypothetical protein [Actinomadura barringtoniae]MBO2448372.1 hypothetical protein [Actinomadura barringtoniae]
MPAERIHWEDLPCAARQQVEQHTGQVVAVRTVSTGRNSAVAAVLESERGRVFIKGVDHSQPRRWTQDMEEMINPYVLSFTPRLLWRVNGDWDILGFEYLDGRHADYAPGSPDVDKVVLTFTELGRLPCPDLPLKRPEHRWGAHVDDPADLEWFRGDRLQHIDPTPPNLVMAEGKASLIDWAWPTRGAAWLDPACLVIRLIEAGHTPEQAEDVVGAVPSWGTAPPEGLRAFALANLRMWSKAANGRPFEITKAAQAWFEYRTVQTAAS